MPPWPQASAPHTRCIAMPAWPEWHKLGHVSSRAIDQTKKKICPHELKRIAGSWDTRFYLQARHPARRRAGGSQRATRGAGRAALSQKLQTGRQDGGGEGEVQCEGEGAVPWAVASGVSGASVGGMAAAGARRRQALGRRTARCRGVSPQVWGMRVLTGPWCGLCRTARSSWRTRR